MLERAIEGPRQQFFANAAVFGSEASAGVVLLAWPAAPLAAASEAALLALARERAANASFHPWELPAALVRAAEGWEFAPRAKLRAHLVARFGARLNRAAFEEQGLLCSLGGVQPGSGRRDGRKVEFIFGATIGQRPVRNL